MASFLIHALGLCMEYIHAVDRLEGAQIKKIQIIHIYLIASFDQVENEHGKLENKVSNDNY